ncbi:hypothetical protein LIER_27868 [Lithospermum erythrorhizon]|uniref:Uncharacterized protein n=1 Tax=Lithospermum erythrorhizon TaxID=34254 RepID=A0AAV3RDK6_LITER
MGGNFIARLTGFETILTSGAYNLGGSLHSTTGYCVFLDSNFVAWSSKNQPTVERSSIEVEHKALALAAAEVTLDATSTQRSYVLLYVARHAFCDNIAATYLAHNRVLHFRGKHISIDYHFVGENVALADLIVNHIPIDLQPTDVLTMDLPSLKFHTTINNLCLSSVAQIEGGVRICTPISYLS